MKNKITKSSTLFSDELEAKIRKKEAELTESAKKDAIHFAKRNLPAPKGDNLEPYTGGIKTGCEKMYADIKQHLQPSSRLPQAQMDTDHFEDKDRILDEEIKELQDKNEHDSTDLDGYSPGTLSLRILLVFISTFIILLGEIIFNTKAFQITGENMLFSLIISISVSFTVFIASHIAPFVYKEAKNTFHKRLVVGITLISIICLFSTLAIFRTNYLATHDVQISPLSFIIINLFLFLVSTLVSFFFLPSWREIKNNAHHTRLYYAIRKRIRKIEKLKREKAAIKEILVEDMKQYVQIIHLSNYSAERMRKLYNELVEIFKTTNLKYRTDRQTPDCFLKTPPPPDIQDFTFNVKPIKPKLL